MTQPLSLSPSIFDRLESLKKWQTEQQQKLRDQQSQQSKFLSNEHQRMYKALGIQKVEREQFSDASKMHEYENSNSSIDETENFDGEMENSSRTSFKNSDVDEIPIKSPLKDFVTLLEEKLQTETPNFSKNTKPKREYLKKGAGLSRFRMTINDLAHRKPNPVLPINKKRILPLVKSTAKQKQEVSKLSAESNSEFINPSRTNIEYSKNYKDGTKNLSPLVNTTETQPFVSSSINKKPNISFHNYIKKENSASENNYSEPKATWTSVPKAKVSDYQVLLAELMEVRQQNPTLFDSPSINKSSENDQQMSETGLEELKLFEALEQKASNSSFCSTSSIVTRLMEHPIKSTPKKQLNFDLLTQEIPENHVFQGDKLPLPYSKRIVSFSDKPKTEETEDETIFTDDNESSSSSNSSVTSDNVCNVNTIVPTKYKNRESECKNSVKIFKDVAVNTDQPVLNSELLKTRLEELEKELNTFRSENARVNKLKTQLESNNRNFEKRKRQLEKDIEEQKKQIKQQLDEEKAKLIKDRAVYDRYAREIKEGKSARQKEKEELNLLRSRISTLEEEVKLKESKWGATQARIRSQLKHLEKENAILRTENNELRSKNGKLEASNKQLLSRRPTDTKVLHEINKNLTRIAQEAKEKPEKADKIKKSDKENVKKKSLTSTHSDKNTDNRECKRHSLNSTDNSDTDQSFESVERQYEKLMGKFEENLHVPIAETSASSNASARRDETVLEDGTTKITYSNGNVRTISADGKMIVMKYHNGDLKETCKDTGTIRYLYADAKTCHTTYPDGSELLEFANGQIERRFADGACEINFPNGCRMCTSPGGTEEVAFPDGTLLLNNSNGERILTLPNGQREIHTSDHKRREYPDGTVKLVYPDGVQETRYANGRIRLRDKQRNLIMDSAAV